MGHKCHNLYWFSGGGGGGGAEAVYEKGGEIKNKAMAIWARQGTVDYHLKTGLKLAKQNGTDHRLKLQWFWALWHR